MQSADLVTLVSVLIGSIALIGTLVTSLRSASKGAFEDLQKVVDLLRADLTEAKSDLAVAKTDLKDAWTQIEKLQTDRRDLRDQVAALTKENKALHEDIGRLTQDNDRLSKENVNLRTTVADLSARVNGQSGVK